MVSVQSVPSVWEAAAHCLHNTLWHVESLWGYTQRKLSQCQAGAGDLKTSFIDLSVLNHYTGSHFWFCSISDLTSWCLTQTLQLKKTYMCVCYWKSDYIGVFVCTCRRGELQQDAVAAQCDDERLLPHTAALCLPGNRTLEHTRLLSWREKVGTTWNILSYSTWNIKKRCFKLYFYPIHF